MHTKGIQNQKTLNLIKRHQLANLSEKLIHELFHLTVDDHFSLSIVWGMTGMICMISRDMWDIYKLINILTEPNSDYTIMVIQLFYTNLFYCCPCSNLNLYYFKLRRLWKSCIVFAHSSCILPENSRFLPSMISSQQS